MGRDLKVGITGEGNVDCVGGKLKDLCSVVQSVKVSGINDRQEHLILHLMNRLQTADSHTTTTKDDKI